MYSSTTTSFLVIVLLSVMTSCINGTPVLERRGNHLARRYSGKATWFTPDTGACGDTNSSSDLIVAINHAQYEGGAPCHKTVSITNKANGKTVKAKVTDECPPCGYGSLDLSPSAFQALGDMDEDFMGVCMTASIGRINNFQTVPDLLLLLLLPFYVGIMLAIVSSTITLAMYSCRRRRIR